jgi:hypothetical protein
MIFKPEARFQAIFMLLQVLAHVGSERAPSMLSYSSGCLLIAHVVPLCKSWPNLEKALCEGRLHSIIYRYSIKFGNTHSDLHSHEPRFIWSLLNCILFRLKFKITNRLWRD